MNIEDRLIELAQKATPGPWRQAGAILAVIRVDDGTPEGGEAVAACASWKMPLAQKNNDAAYIAACSPSVVSAIAEVVRATRGLCKCGRCDLGRANLDDALDALDGLDGEK